MDPWNNPRGFSATDLRSQPGVTVPYIFGRMNPVQSHFKPIWLGLARFGPFCVISANFTPCWINGVIGLFWASLVFLGLLGLNLKPKSQVSYLSWMPTTAVLYVFAPHLWYSCIICIYCRMLNRNLEHSISDQWGSTTPTFLLRVAFWGRLPDLGLSMEAVVPVTCHA